MTASLRSAGALLLAFSLIAPPAWAGSFAKPARKRSQQVQVTGKLERAAQAKLPSAAARERLPSSLPAVQLPGAKATPRFVPAATPAPSRKRPGRTKTNPREDAAPQGVARPQIDRFSPIKPAAGDKPGKATGPAGALGAGGSMSEAPTRDADGNFRFGNGQGVPGSDPQGRPGKIAADGSIHYVDGTRVTHDPVTGDTKATRPGQPSTVWRGTRRDDDGAIRFHDGTRVPGTDASGTPGKIQGDGSISYSDGTRITHDPVGGDTKAVGPNGVTVWHRGDGAADGEHTPGGFGPAGDEASGHDTTWNDEQGAFDFGDGYGAPARDSNGSLGKINGDGTVGYADGTVFDHDRQTGDTKIHHGDGSVSVWGGNDARYGGGHQGGTRYNRDQGAFDFGDGYGAPATDASGTPGKVNSDGTISYSDGTWVSHDTESGDTKVVRPDGSVDVYSGDDERYEGSSSSSDSSSSSSSDSSSSDSSSNDTSSDSSSSDSDSDSSSDSSSSDSDADSSDTDAAADKPASEDTKGTKGYTPGPGWTGGETGTNQDSDKRWLKNIDIVGNPGPNGGVAGGDPNASPDPVPTSIGPGANPGDGQWAPSPWRNGPPLPGSEGVLINPNPVDAPATGGDGPPPGLPEPPVHTR